VAEFETAAARVVAARSARVVAAAAHQVHGALGCTQEYPLQLFTRRLWAWRGELGGRPSELGLEVGRQVASHGAEGLYPLIASGSAPDGAAGSDG
jgi:acyl-CoA dehydrogenase